MMCRGHLTHSAWIKPVPSCYTSKQAVQWLECMGLGALTNEQSISTSTFVTSLENLALLVKHHLLTFPFENTQMHYSPEHAMDITPTGVFQRLVVERRGGSYCFGLNGIMLGMLRALGYRAYSTAARVNRNYAASASEVQYTSQIHQVIFVQPGENNSTYLVDVGFGLQGLARPIFLSGDESNIIMGLGSTGKHRLSRRAFPGSSLESSRNSGHPCEIKWNLEVFHEKTAETVNDDPPRWRTLYSFSEEEFYPQDFHDASFIACASPNPHSLFWNNVLCVKDFVLKEDHTEYGGGRGMGMAENVKSADPIYRLVLMGSEVKKHIGGKSETIRTLSNEMDRVHALYDLFGVKVEESGVAHISGRVPAF